MHHDQYRPLDCADPEPTLLAVDDAIFSKQQSGIGEYTRRGLKIYACVLLLIRPVLFPRPKFELHAVIHNV
jgi:hypothetical protein